MTRSQALQLVKGDLIARKGEIGSDYVVVSTEETPAGIHVTIRDVRGHIESYHHADLLRILTANQL